MIYYDINFKSSSLTFLYKFEKYKSMLNILGLTIPVFSMNDAIKKGT